MFAPRDSDRGVLTLWLAQVPKAPPCLRLRAAVCVDERQGRMDESMEGASSRVRWVGLPYYYSDIVYVETLLSTTCAMYFRTFLR